MRVVLEAIGLREAHDIEPVLRPALTVMWTGEQAVDHRLPRARRAVLQKGVDICSRWWQSREIEVGAADQNLAAGLGRKRETVFREPREQKRIDRICGAGHRWRADGSSRLESPMASLGGRIC